MDRNLYVRICSLLVTLVGPCCCNSTESTTDRIDASVQLAASAASIPSTARHPKPPVDDDVVRFMDPTDKPQGFTGLAKGPPNYCETEIRNPLSAYGDIVVGYAIHGGPGYSTRSLIVRSSGWAEYWSLSAAGSGPAGFPKTPCDKRMLSKKAMESFFRIVKDNQFCEHAPKVEPTWETHGTEVLCVRIDDTVCFAKVNESDYTKDRRIRVLVNALAQFSTSVCASPEAPKLPLLAPDGG